MKRYTVILLVTLCSCFSRHYIFHSSPLIGDALVKGKEIKIYISRDGDAFTDPSDHYEIIISKADSFLSKCGWQHITAPIRNAGIQLRHLQKR